MPNRIMSKEYQKVEAIVNKFFNIDGEEGRSDGELKHREAQASSLSMLDDMNNQVLKRKNEESPSPNN